MNLIKKTYCMTFTNQKGDTTLREFTVILPEDYFFDFEQDSLQVTGISRIDVGTILTLFNNSGDVLEDNVLYYDNKNAHLRVTDNTGELKSIPHNSILDILE